jgi:glycosyltransferase involved in cell wall biosynthesis
VRALGVRFPYILAVGTLEPRKNYVRLLEAYAQLRARGWTQQLVIAGRPGWLYEPIYERLSELGMEEHVQVVDANDETLAALYGLTDVFVCASVYEGFGIPVVEALACAAPVACSRAASLPEVAGDAALLFEPTDVGEMTDAIERLLEDRALAERLSARGPGQVARFSWATSARLAVKMFREVSRRA